jgi:hypothetical protein
MTGFCRPRRLLALVAAYLIALQALLLPLSLTPAIALSVSLCSSGTATAGTSAPANHPTGCPCAAGCGMQCCAPALAAPPPTPAIADVAQTEALRLRPVSQTVIQVVARGSYRARGPPIG